jgi:hypothetical protein
MHPTLRGVCNLSNSGVLAGFVLPDPCASAFLWTHPARKLRLASCAPVKNKTQIYLLNKQIWRHIQRCSVQFLMQMKQVVKNCTLQGCVFMSKVRIKRRNASMGRIYPDTLVMLVSLQLLVKKA